MSQLHCPDSHARPWRRALYWPLLGLCTFAVTPARADLDVVFLLDTTGSMGGELREVKQRVGELATSLAAARAGEALRFGVVAYKDRGDVYVTRISPLSADIETSRSFLAALRAQGGGDGPESVIAGLAAALRDMNWSYTEGVERQIFLIGDAPPHLDYDDDPKPEDLLEEARNQEIVIHAIGCRSLPRGGVAFFRRMAFRTEGTYQHIGRVKAAEPGVAEAMIRASTPGEALTTDRGDEILLTWWKHQHEFEAPGLLVRPTGPVQSDQDSQSPAVKAPCSLEFQIPRGLALGASPRAWLSPDGLTVELQLTSGEGGLDIFTLERCPPLAAPIRLLAERS